MREIKFRAWVEKSKRMVDVKGLYYVFCGYPKAEGRQRLIEVEYRKLTIDSYSLESNDVILMQYTGLNDKNGKEIYEGDIMVGGAVGSATSNFSILNDVPTRVHFKNGMFKLGGMSLSTFNNRAEVIGNIYENPELIN